MIPPPPTSTLFPYTTLFRSGPGARQIARLLTHINDFDVTAEVLALQFALDADLVGNLTFEPSDGGEFLTLADRKSTRLNSSHTVISYAVFCLKKKTEGKTDE